MLSAKKIRVKICCSNNINEAQLAIQNGASSLGLVPAMPNVLLAGKLNYENIREAIEQVPPSRVDVCNGMHTNGRLDERMLEKFFKQVDYLL